MNSYFDEVKKVASNISGNKEKGGYTAKMFQEDFPQFFKAVEENTVSLVPDTMLEIFIAQANDSVLSSRWGSSWRYACGLHVAHFSTMYLKTYAVASENARQVANSAAQMGVIKSASMGDTTVSYDNSAITAGTEKWGTWNTTQYGAQLVTMARMVGMGGIYVI